MQQLLENKEDILPEQHEWNLNIVQKDSEPPNIKEEQEELWSEDEDKPQSSQLLQSQRDVNTEVHLLVRNSTEHRTLKLEVKEDCGGSEPASNWGLLSHLQPDTDGMQQFLPIKKEILPEQQERNLSVHQQDIKEEQEKLWISLQGQELHQLEGAGVTESPFTVVSVKNENDDEKPQSAQVHQTQSDDWKQTRNLCSDFNILKNTNIVSSNNCEIAEKQFNCSKNMNNSEQHKVTQGSVKSFSCPTQGKRQKQKRTQNKHTSIKIGKKSFGCSECRERFQWESDWTRHMLTHTAERPFLCSECGQRFRRKTNLSTHMTIHTGEKPFGCSECSKRFRYKSTLKSHMIIHSGEKAFGCPECSQRYGRKSNLKAHMVIHTGRKPFSCAECGQIFGHRSSLNSHMMKH